MLQSSFDNCNDLLGILKNSQEYFAKDMHCTFSNDFGFRIR